MTSLRLLPMPTHEDSLGTGILTLEHLDMSTAHRLVKQIRDLPDAWVTGASHRRVLFWR